MIATRWLGWCSLVVVGASAVAVAVALAVAGKASTIAGDERWRELTFRTVIVGWECRSTPEQSAIHRAWDEEAAASCVHAWGATSEMAVHAMPDAPGVTKILTDETSMLRRCLDLRDASGRFCHLGFARRPADAALRDAPAAPRPRAFDEFAFQREREREAVASGFIVSVQCPAAASPPTFVGLPSRELQSAWQSCQQRDKGWFELSLDEAGVGIGVNTTPDQLTDAPCVLARACGLRFAGLGPVLAL